jgi:hypothetical protein
MGRSIQNTTGALLKNYTNHMIYIKNVDAGWGSHLPVLIKLASITNGPILELGLGLFSTVFLYWACYDKKRKLVSADNSRSFFSKFMNFGKDFHTMVLVEGDNWDAMDMDGPWDIVFIDHHPRERRGRDAARVAYSAKYVVLHDTQPDKRNPYGYDEIYPLFKYRFDYTGPAAHTTVLSNVIDLSDFTV